MCNSVSHLRLLFGEGASMSSPLPSNAPSRILARDFSCRDTLQFHIHHGSPLQPTVSTRAHYKFDISAGIMCMLAFLFTLHMCCLNLIISRRCTFLFWSGASIRGERKQKKRLPCISHFSALWMDTGLSQTRAGVMADSIYTPPKEQDQQGRRYFSKAYRYKNKR